MACAAIADAQEICNDDILQYALIWEEQVRLHLAEIKKVAAAKPDSAPQHAGVAARHRSPPKPDNPTAARVAEESVHPLLWQESNKWIKR